jgi:hypothetical protein
LTVRLWKDDVDGAFVRDCENSVGFAMRPSEGDAGKKATREDFYKLAHKWHVRVGKAFINCLEESEYMTVRNSLAGADARDVGVPRDQTRRRAHPPRRREDSKDGYEKRFEDGRRRGTWRCSRRLK